MFRPLKNKFKTSFGWWSDHQNTGRTVFVQPDHFASCDITLRSYFTFTYVNTFNNRDKSWIMMTCHGELTGYKSSGTTGLQWNNKAPDLASNYLERHPIDPAAVLNRSVTVCVVLLHRQQKAKVFGLRKKCNMRDVGPFSLSHEYCITLLVVA